MTVSVPQSTTAASSSSNECICVFESSKFTSLVNILICFSKIVRLSVYFDIDREGIKITFMQNDSHRLASMFLAARDHFSEFHWLVQREKSLKGEGVDDSDDVGRCITLKSNLTDLLHAFGFVLDIMKTSKPVIACTDGVRIDVDGLLSIMSVSLSSNSSIGTTAPFDCGCQLRGDFFDPRLRPIDDIVQAVGAKCVAKAVLKSALFAACIGETVGGTLEEVQVQFEFVATGNVFTFSIVSAFATTCFSVHIAGITDDGSCEKGIGSSGNLCEMYECTENCTVTVEGKRLLAFRELLKWSSRVALSLMREEEEEAERDGEEETSVLFLGQLMVPFGVGDSSMAFIEYDLMCSDL